MEATMTKTEEAPKASVKREIIYRLKPTRLEVGFEGTRVRCWFAVPEEGTPYAELFKPSYWEIHAAKFHIGDMIRVEPDEGHYMADLRVMSTGIGGVRVQEYYRKDWETAEIPNSLASHYRVKYAGPHHKWRVERKSDGHIVQPGFANENDGNRWLANNIRQLEMDAAQKAEKS